MSATNPRAEQMLSPDYECATPGAAPGVMPWAEARKRLSEPAMHRTIWLTTVRPDRRPHVVPIGSLWIDDELYFTMGQGTRKGKNLAENTHCVISTTGDGIDFVIEGTAAKLTEPAQLQHVADGYTKHGWPLSYTDGKLDAPYNAPTTGPSPIEAYLLTPTRAYCFGTAEDTWNRATRYLFS